MTILKNTSLITGTKIFGIAMAAPFFLWAALSLTGLVPTLVEVFGIPGLRIPASITILGLLIAAVASYGD